MAGSSNWGEGIGGGRSVTHSVVVWQNDRLVTDGCCRADQAWGRFDQKPSFVPILGLVRLAERLLRSGTDRIEAHDFIIGAEDIHQLRHQTFDRSATSLAA